MLHGTDVRHCLGWLRKPIQAIPFSPIRLPSRLGPDVRFSTLLGQI
jgi:hypothetical protein